MKLTPKQHLEVIEEAIVSTIKLLLVYSAFHFIIKYW
mgnify:CR=1 FL=1